VGNIDEVHDMLSTQRRLRRGAALLVAVDPAGLETAAWISRVRRALGFDQAADDRSRFRGGV